MKFSKFPQSVIVQFFLVGMIVLSLCLSLFCDYREQKKMRVERMRDQMDFSELYKLESGDYAIKRSSLEKFLEYFQSVINNEPTRFDAYALLGYCYYYLGDKDKAKFSYQQAVMLNPGFSGAQYDLAMIEYEQGHYKEALMGFQKVLAVRAPENVIFLRKSKIFLYIIYKVEPLRKTLGEHLRISYGLSAYFSSVCCQKLGDQKQAFFFRQQSQNLGLSEKDPQPRLRLF